MAKIKPPTRLYDVALSGELEGVRLKMRGMSTRDLIKLRSGDVSDLEALEMVATHIVEHNLDTSDVLELDAWIGIAILGAWSDAIKDAALPPATATSSEPR